MSGMAGWLRLRAGVTSTLRNNMLTYELKSTSPDETNKIGINIGRQLKVRDIVCVIGELGAGKTTLIKGIASGAGVKNGVTSPSYKLINEYNGEVPFYHFDLYRLDSVLDVQELGYREYFYGNGITVVEWAEKMESLLPEERMEIHLTEIRIGRFLGWPVRPLNHHMKV